MNKKIEFKNILVFLIVAVGIALVVTLLCFLSKFKTEEKTLSGYKEIENSLLKIANYKSYEIKKSEVVLKMIKSDDTFDDFAYQIDTVLTKKGDKARVDSYYFAGDSKEYFGGIYVCPKYTEFMYTDSESVYFSSGDIFKVVKTYLPTLSEVCDDFEKINFGKIKNVVSKSINTYIKKHGKELYEDYSTYFENELSKYITQEEVKESTSVKYYKLKMNIKEFVELESKVLIKIKHDKKVSDMITGVATDLIKYLEKTEEYKKIRMTEDEFNTLKYNYEEEISSFFEKEMTKRIDYVQALYTGVVSKNDDKYIELVFKLDDEGNIESIATEGVTFLDDAVVSNLVTYTISKINEVKNEDIVPTFPSRTDLVFKTRNELYSIFESVKVKYEEKEVSFFSNLLGLDKVKE